MRKTPFNGRLLMMGCGAVAQCTLPLLLRHLAVSPERVTVLDTVDNRDRIRGPLAAGVHYVREQIVRDGYARQLEPFVEPGDLIVDLTWNLGCTDLLEWCHEREVLYINTSVELWDPHARRNRLSIPQQTLYARQMAIRPVVQRWRDRPGTTAILDHGANPGLVSHFTRQALMDIGQRILEVKPFDERSPAVADALSARQFARLAQLVGLKVIHISERDTQVSSQAKEPDEFVNTWSVEGFFEEAIAPAELGWGTHERGLPDDAVLHEEGPRNQICLERFGMNTLVRSCVLSGEIEGMVIRHGEAFSISEALTVFDDSGEAAYRPTVHYAYRPCDAAWESLAELRERNYQLQPHQRIMEDDITAGGDELGCLSMGHDFRSWWTGSIVDIHEARRLVPGQNATTLQVAASVLAAVCWMIRHPRQGVLLPDHVPHDEILEIARPYLGEFVSQEMDWMPVRTQGTVVHPEDADYWQFRHFELPGPPRNISGRMLSRQSA